MIRLFPCECGRWIEVEIKTGQGPFKKEYTCPACGESYTLKLSKTSIWPVVVTLILAITLVVLVVLIKFVW